MYLVHDYDVGGIVDVSENFPVIPKSLPHNGVRYYITLPRELTGEMKRMWFVGNRRLL